MVNGAPFVIAADNAFIESVTRLHEVQKGEIALLAAAPATQGGMGEWKVARRKQRQRERLFE